MTNLFSRFRNLFRKAEPDYDYDESYEDSYDGYEEYSDVAVEEPAAEPLEPEEPQEVIQSGRVLNLPQGARAGAAEPPGEEIRVPLAPIVAGMPLELQSRILYEVGELCIFLPLERILPQLSTGAVSLPFGEVREAAPNMFSTSSDQDAVEVNVPLSAILPQVSPEMLARKQAPAQFEIPDDIVSPFAGKGKGLAISSVRTAPASGQTQPAPSPAPVQPAQPTPPPVLSPAASQVRPASIPPRKPLGGPAPQGNVPPRPAASPNLPFPRQPQPSPISQESPPLRAKPPTSQPHPVPSTVQGVSKPQGVSKLPSAPVSSPAARSPLTVTISAVAGGWPDSLKQEIIQLGLAEAKLAIPFDVVESGLKRGRLNFSWSKLKSWIRPEFTPPVSIYDGTDLELPLRVIAPIFIEQKKEQPQKSAKVAVDKNIPNLFFGLPQPDTAGVAIDHTVNRPMDTNYYVWDDQHDTVPDTARNDATSNARTAGTEFVTRYATPNEVVSRAASLDGVEGAVIALPDGLMVASQLPGGINGDTLAAFLPHLFGKVSQCTQELRMGELNNLNFTVGNVPWKLFRVNALYFAAFGRKGEPMPTSRLAALAAELDHKAKV